MAADQAARAGIPVDADVNSVADADAGPDGGCDRPDEPRWRPLLGAGLFNRRSPGGGRYLAALVWLLFVVFPVLNAIGKHGSPVGHGLIIGGAALFVATYATLVVRWRSGHGASVSLLLVAVLMALATVLTLTQASGWGFLFTYCAACVAVAAPEGTGFYGVALCSILAAVTSAIAGADGGTVLRFVASSAGIGLLMLVMSDLRQRNEQLNAARAELARMAVAQERERFARDLHDLLGHSLSVIALKAELAGRMLTDRPRKDASEPDVLERAATEVRELEQVARTALGEVREAVSGYPSAHPRRIACRRPHGPLRRGHQCRRPRNAGASRPGRRGRPRVDRPRGRHQRHPPQRRAALHAPDHGQPDRRRRGGDR
jgi:hypothetical protein